MMKNLKKKKGFTLIELIIVIAILGILAAVAIPNLSGTQKSAKIKADVASAKVIADTAAILVAEDVLISNGASGTVKASAATSAQLTTAVGVKLGALPSIQADVVPSGSWQVINTNGAITVNITDGAATPNTKQLYPSSSAYTN